MKKILLLLQHKQNRHLLSQSLQEAGYEVFYPSINNDFIESHDTFDLCILGPIALDKFSDWVEATKKAEEPVFFTVSFNNIPLGCENDNSISMEKD
jgi:hypothetical protein